MRARGPAATTPRPSTLLVVAAAMSVFAKGRFEATITALALVLAQLARVGGSWAQRDRFEHTLLAAYRRAGRHADAAALLRRRVDRQPSVPVART